MIQIYFQMAISYTKIIWISIGEGTETLGRHPGTDVFCDSTHL